jgi:ribosomal protein L37AE/L43A
MEMWKCDLCKNIVKNAWNVQLPHWVNEYFNGQLLHEKIRLQSSNGHICNDCAKKFADQMYETDD